MVFGRWLPKDQNIRCQYFYVYFMIKFTIVSKKHNFEFYHSKIEKWTHFPQKICKQFAYFWGNERKYFSHIAGLGHLKGPTKKLWAFTFFEVFNLSRSFGSIVEYLQMMLCFTQYVIHWPQMVPKWTGRSIAGPIAHKYWAQGLRQTQKFEGEKLKNIYCKCSLGCYILVGGKLY